MTGLVAVAQLFTLPLALLQGWWALRTVVLLRQGRVIDARTPLGLAFLAGVALVSDSLLSFQPALLAGDAANLAVLWWAWRGADRAGARAREAWGIEQVDRLDHAAARDRRASPMEAAARARAERDDLDYLDDLAGDDPGPNRGS